MNKLLGNLKKGIRFIIHTNYKTCKICRNSPEFNFSYFHSDCKTKDEFCKKYCKKKEVDKK